MKIATSESYCKDVKNLNALINSKYDCYYNYFLESKYSFSFPILHQGEIRYESRHLTIPKLRAVKLTNCLITGRCCVINEKGMVKECLPPWLTLNKLEDYQSLIEENFNVKNDISYQEVMQSKTRSINEPIIVLTSIFDEAFSHFIFETFSKLHLFTKTNINEFKWLISSDTKGYQKNILIDAGIKKENIIEKENNEVIECDAVMVIETPSHNNMWATPASIMFLREFFLHSIADTPFSIRSEKKVYLDRADERSAMRSITNENELISIANSNGYVNFTPGKMTFSEKSKIISKAEYIIGQYGGGLQLCFISPINAKIIVLQSPHFFRHFISFMASVFGYQVINIMGNPILVDDEKKHNNSSFSLSSADFTLSIDMLL